MTVLRLTDLSHPVLTEAQLRAVREAEADSVDLSAAAILQAARSATGMDDFGKPDFLERLEIWLQSGREDEGLGALGRAVLYQYCVRYATNRLRLEDRVRRHPEILDLRVDRPVFIAGLPRSGTTHLVNLMARDRRWRSLPYWEAIDPFPEPGERDTRRDRSAAAWTELDALLPHLKSMHEMSPDHVHEDLELQAIDFTTYNIEWTARVPRWRDWYFSHDRRPHYAYLKKALQALQWQDTRNGVPRRWLLKCPQHLENLPALIETFPDATVVITHRDPVEVIQSAVTAIAYGDRIRRSTVDVAGTADYWIDRVERMLRACVRDRAAIPTTCSEDIIFPEYIADEMATLEKVYCLAGVELTNPVRADMQGFALASKSAKVKVAYDFEADLGHNADEVRSRFAFYLARFPGLLGRR